MNKKNIFFYSLLFTLLLFLLTACYEIATPTPTQTKQPPTQTVPPSKTPTPSKTPPPTATPKPTLTPEGEIGSSWIRPKDGMEMVYVPKGVFTMGSDNGDADEQPIHDIYLDAFWVDKYEVSKTMYALFDFSQSRGNEPVRDISWDQASAYCAWVGGHLPTEAEWEKAAHGFNAAIYPWGNQPPRGDLVNFADINSKLSWEDTSVDDGYKTIAPVNAYPAGMSAYGSLNMSGNISEWVNDWYDETYYSISPPDNPQGPPDGIFRIVRGGSYISTAAGIRSAERNWYIPEGSTEYIGFRCVKSTIFP